MEMNLLHRKERLILTTIDIIEELGIQGLTTREIAKREDVSEATIFRHFLNKNELLLAVLDYYIQFDSDINQSIRLNRLKPTDAIRFLIIKVAEYYENYPAITAITQIFDVLRYDTELEGKVKEIHNNRLSMIRELIKEAQIAGEIPPDTDSGLMSITISGMFRELCSHWRLQNYNYSLKEQTVAALNMLLEAFQSKK
jgi:AcrR family transcriptional regulator